MGLHVVKNLLYNNNKKKVSEFSPTPPMEWEKIFLYIKGLIIRIYGELKKLISQKSNEPIKK
jgi:hypothetical protein